MKNKSIKGFTLIELMVAVALMTFLIGVVVRIFVSTTQTVSETEARMAVVQNMRVLIDSLSSDLSGAKGGDGDRRFVMANVTSDSDTVFLAFNAVQEDVSTTPSTKISRRIEYEVSQADAGEAQTTFTLFQIIRRVIPFNDDGSLDNASAQEGVLAEFVDNRSTRFAAQSNDERIANMLIQSVPQVGNPPENTFTGSGTPYSIILTLNLTDQGRVTSRTLLREFHVSSTN